MKTIHSLKPQDHKATLRKLEKESEDLVWDIKNLQKKHDASQIAVELSVKQVNSIYTQTAAFKALYTAYYALAKSI